MRTELKVSYRMVQYEYAYRYTPKWYIINLKHLDYNSPAWNMKNVTKLQ